MKGIRRKAGKDSHGRGWAHTCHQNLRPWKESLGLKHRLQPFPASCRGPPLGTSTLLLPAQCYLSWGSAFMRYDLALLQTTTTITHWKESSSLRMLGVEEVL